MENVLLPLLPSLILSASPVSHALGVPEFQTTRQAERQAYHRTWQGLESTVLACLVTAAAWKPIHSLTLNPTRWPLPVESELGRECPSL